MYKLETTHPVIFNNFKDNGLHVIRRSDTYWSGLSSDLIIEQGLMQSMKTSGGLTRGRGMGKVQRTIWLLLSPACTAVIEAIQNLTGIRYESSDQHKETTNARHVKDYKDIVTITRYISDYNPFISSSDLINIENGEDADSSVNVAREIGTKIIDNMVGTPVLDYCFKKKIYGSHHES